MCYSHSHNYSLPRSLSDKKESLNLILELVYVCLPFCLDSRKFITSLGGNGPMFIRCGRTNVSATVLIHCSPSLLYSGQTLDLLILFFFVALQHLFKSLFALNYRDSISTKLTQLATRVGRLLTPVSHLNTSQCRSWEKLAIFSKLENFPESNWPNLTWLALTSRLLVPRERSAELDDMLQAAAAATMDMPNLGKKKKKKGNMERREGAWDSVSLKHCGQGNVIIKELLDISDSSKSHGNAIRHLQLSKPVVRPASLRQIQMMHTV
ncbi:uncharacterized protein EAF02_000253 [Botrytis sinoallii]|uniref:uncharacterized protein n=1 Tax=Botrytis sinoallii TaxID=1463999 RepID=UPI0018FF8B02|nr:uncharacterized protein EAF02_000253 [Botrytis sinoallii]KAF7892715.1 hypothetical protein EAF02_000253 [Botrytis sinoallii]